LSALTVQGPPAVFSLGIERKSATIGPAARDQLRKRDVQDLQKREALSLTLDNEGTLYFANVTLGTPGQALRLDIDTGSSDIWANSATSNLCVRYQTLCDQSGTYSANKSSSYQFVNSDFYIKYADNSSAQGDYATDVLTMGTTSLTNVPFGIGYVSTSPQGILGVGYAINEASVSTDGRTYQNLPQVMATSKLINTPAYSLWLNDLEANTGSILFGGVDSDKYQGSLATLPIIKEEGAYREFIVALTGLTAAGETVIDTAIPVLLDSGSSLSYLPTTYYNALNTIFAGQPNDQAGASLVSCSYMNSQNTIDFSFSGLTVTVPMSEMILVEGTRRGEPVCILGEFPLHMAKRKLTKPRHQRRRRLNRRPRRHLPPQRLRRVRPAEQPDQHRADRLQRDELQRRRDHGRRRARRQPGREPSLDAERDGGRRPRAAGHGRQHRGGRAADARPRGCAGAGRGGGRGRVGACAVDVLHV
jgi:hypothetical protein